MTTIATRAVSRALVEVDQAHVPDPASRVHTLAWLRGQLDAELAEAVRAWKDAGASWSDVGALFGSTRQAAQQRWGGAGDS